MMFSQILFKFNQIFLKSFVRLHNFSLIFCKNSCTMIIHAIFLHQERNHKRRTSRHSHLAMNKHIMILEHVLDICMGKVKVRVNLFVFIVLQVNPFMVLYLDLLNLFFDFIVVKGPLVNNT